MKLAYKLVLGYLLVASIAGSATYFALHSYGNIDAAFDRLTDDPIPTLKVLNDLKFSAKRVVSLTNEVELGYAESKNIDDAVPGQSDTKEVLADTERQFVAAGKEYDELLADYENLIRNQSIVERKYLADIKKTGSELIAVSAKIIELKKKGVSDEEFREQKAQFAALQKKYFQAIDESRLHEYKQLQDERKIVEVTIKDSTRTTLAITFLTLTLSAVLGLYISRSIASRITKLKKASESVGDGELNTNIKVESTDEIGALTNSFNKMIGDLRASRADLKASETFVNNIVSSIADSVIVLDTDLKIIRLNEATLNLTAYREPELLGRSIKSFNRNGEFFNDRDLEELHTKNFINGIDTVWQTKDNREVPITFSASLMRDPKGTVNGIVCVAKDITVRKSLEDQLSHQTLHDSLTKLANRVLFHNRVEHALARISRSHEPIAVMFLDLDNFKTVNDTLGHAAGDELLKAVSARLIACLRQSDTIARLGGDEFAILVENITQIEEVLLIAERLNAVLREPFLIAGKEALINTSIGIAFSGGYNETLEDFLRNADVAMYKAKNQGKDRYVVFESRMREDLIERVEFEAALRRAVERNEFVLHYQPIFNLEDSSMIGMEALVRWHHPQKGLIPPDKFIPIAEETNLIVPLGQWVLEEACRQTGYWQEKFPDRKHLSISVNLSNKQVQEDNLVEQVAYALAESNLPPENLVLEITESTMLHETEATIEKLKHLKELGIRLAIDDFGTGYSSLSYLQRFPVDVLKIDKSFVDRINQNQEGAAVARAIITMSETLQLKTIAEGIETDGQNIALQKMGCEFGQGYHFAKPLTKEAMNEFLNQADSIEKDQALANKSLAENIIV